MYLEPNIISRPSKSSLIIHKPQELFTISKKGKSPLPLQSKIPNWDLSPPHYSTTFFLQDVKKLKYRVTTTPPAPLVIISTFRFHSQWPHSEMWDVTRGEFGISIQFVRLKRLRQVMPKKRVRREHLSTWISVAKSVIIGLSVSNTFDSVGVIFPSVLYLYCLVINFLCDKWSVLFGCVCVCVSPVVISIWFTRG